MAIKGLILHQVNPFGSDGDIVGLLYLKDLVPSKSILF